MTTSTSWSARDTAVSASDRHVGLNIGEAARRSGVPAKTIRFYEAQGIIPAAGRSESGYRLYAETDVRRLRLIRRLRGLGLDLAAAGKVAGGAFDAECRDYVRDAGTLFEAQYAEVDRQIAELLTLRDELSALASQARATAVHVPAGRRVDTCGECMVIDGPEPALARSMPVFSHRRPHFGPS